MKISPLLIAGAAVAAFFALKSPNGSAAPASVPSNLDVSSSVKSVVTVSDIAQAQTQAVSVAQAATPTSGYVPPVPSIPISPASLTKAAVSYNPLTNETTYGTQPAYIGGTYAGSKITGTIDSGNSIQLYSGSKFLATLAKGK